VAGALVTTNVLQTIVSMGLDALRENIVLAQTVNRTYEEEIRGRTVGQTVNVVVPASISTRSVAADVVPPAVTAVTPTNVSITVNQWKEAPFAMDDQGLAQVQRGIIPMQVTEAVKSLANTIDDYIWSLIDGAGGVYSYAGVAGTTPFSSNLSEFLNGQKLANDELMPQDPDNVFFVMDTAANANALGLRALQDASYRAGDTRSILRGEIGQILGARWMMSQNVATHTLTGTGTHLVNDASHAAGATTLTWDGGGVAPAAGDIFVVAGDTQTYMVESSSSTVITHRPAGKVALADNAALTFKADAVLNLLYHRDLIGFAMAPLMETRMLPTDNVAIAVDPESGLSLRLEVTRQNKQYQWSFDALYGGQVIRPELGVIIAG
jgi:hypothetical protein